MPKKNANDSIWNRTRDLPACSAVPQPSVQRCAPDFYKIIVLKPIQLYTALGSDWVRLLNVLPRGPLRAFPISALDTISLLVR